RDVLRTGSRGGLSLGDFSLANQREVTRAPRRGAEQDRDVVSTRARDVTHDRNVIPPMLRIDPPRSEGGARALHRASQRTYALYENQQGRSGQCAYARVHVDPSGGGSLRLDRFRRV